MADLKMESFKFTDFPILYAAFFGKTNIDERAKIEYSISKLDYLFE